MPNNKKLNVKDIKKKEGCHPYSRKAKQLARAVNRMDKLDGKKTKVLKGWQAAIADKYLWFKYAMDEDKKVLTLVEIRELIEEYLNREDSDLEFKKGKSFKEDIIKLKQLKDREEYVKNGLEIPDLTNKNNVQTLKEWDGDWNSITSIKKLNIKPGNIKVQEAKETSEIPKVQEVEMME
ncbi:hypothetical protein K502DRAFT_344940 [Neoconidiobolus thromboides FSU 785]|nr:hypothetical protein K502DRAFT_344940 [Neoconidiobolus thromboides FSU 785]